MTSKQRLLTALRRGQPDRLPVTTHEPLQYYLDKYEGGISPQEFFDRYDFDAITWPIFHKPDPTKAAHFDSLQGTPGFLEARRISSEHWHVESEEIPG
jgi:hypothetical protein